MTDLDEYRERAHATKRRRLLGVVALSLGVLVATTSVLWLVARADHRDRGGHLAAVVGVSALVLVVEVVVMVVVLRRRPTSGWNRPAAVLGAEPAVRRRVARAVRRGQLPAQEPDRSLALDLAERALGQRWIIAVFAAAAVLQLPSAALASTTLRVVLHLAAFLALALAAALQVRLLRGARRVAALAGQD